MRPLSLVIGLIGAAILPFGCGAQILDNPFAEYVERGVTIMPGAGNANDANAAIQTIDPWPPYVGDTRIPGDGRRTVNAMERMYRIPNPYAAPQGQGGGATAIGGGSATSITVGGEGQGQGMGQGPGSLPY